MENQIISVKSTFWKSLVVRDNELWLSQNNVSNLEKFEKGIHQTGLMKSAYAYPLESITEVSFNEASEAIKLRYIDEKGKNKKMSFEFGDVELSNHFGHFLGAKNRFAKSEKQESQTKYLMLNGLYLFVAVAMTAWLYSMDDFSDFGDSAKGKRRGMAMLIQSILETIGHTGILLIGILSTAYLGYNLYKRFQNPASEIVYTKVK